MMNLDILAKELEFDREDLVMLLEMYIEGALNSIESIRESLECNDMQTIHKEAHSIKGSSANLKLVDISKLAMLMEEAAKNGLELDYDHILNKIESELKAIEKEMEANYA
jgi:HPt (histidine-containing phosphotransfer) domain-containing protein